MGCEEGCIVEIVWRVNIMFPLQWICIHELSVFRISCTILDSGWILFPFLTGGLPLPNVFACLRCLLRSVNRLSKIQVQNLTTCYCAVRELPLHCHMRTGGQADMIPVRRSWKRDGKHPIRQPGRGEVQRANLLASSSSPWGMVNKQIRMECPSFWYLIRFVETIFPFPTMEMFQYVFSCI